MKKDWIKKKLGDVIKEIKGGGTPSKSNSSYWGGNIAWASVKDMEDNKFSLEDTQDHITKKGLANSSANLIPKNTLIISTRMGLGRCFINKKDMAINQDLKALFPNDQIITKYLLWLYKNKSAEIENMGQGTTVKGIRLEQLRDIEIEIPKSLTEQQKIATTLSNYDNLIENNTKRIELLEKIAKLIYEEWFVKFKFPGHEKVKLVDSELGKIPEGWEVKELGDKIKVLRGKTITRNTITHGKVPVVAGGLNPAYYHNKSNAKGPAITISASGANAGFTRLYFEDIWASDCSYVNSELTSFVYYYYSLMKNRKIEINALQRGSAQPHVYAKDLMRLNIIDPKEELIINFEKIIKLIFEEIACLTFKNQNLSKTRDLLLPRLITGKVDVSELDIQVEVEA